MQDQIIPFFNSPSLQLFDYIQTNAIPLTNPDLPIYIQKQDQLDHYWNLIVQNTTFGIDIEHTPNLHFHGKISLIQISTNNQNYILDAFSLQLKHKLPSLFADPSKIKIFYGSHQDLNWLFQDYQIIVKNLIDIKDIAQALFKDQDNSLPALWNKYCNFNFDKDKKKLLQQSDWSQRPLSQDQIQYAFLDSHYLPYLRFVLLKEIVQTEKFNLVDKLIKRFEERSQVNQQFKLSFNKQDILKKMNKLLNEFNVVDIAHDQDKIYLVQYLYLDLYQLRDKLAYQKDCPKKSVMSDLKILGCAIKTVDQIDKIEEIEECKEQFEQESLMEYLEKLNEWNKILNIYLNWQMRVLKEREQQQKCIFEIEELWNNKKKPNEEEQKKKERQKQYGVNQTKPMYDNCQLLAQDGQLLCYCDQKKIRWYVKQNLADLISENPSIAQIKFQPAGLQNIQDDVDKQSQPYYQTKLENQCVVCSNVKQLCKVHVYHLIIYYSILIRLFHPILENISQLNSKHIDPMMSSYSVQSISFSNNLFISCHEKFTQQQSLFENTLFKDQEQVKDNSKQIQQQIRLLQSLVKKYLVWNIQPTDDLKEKIIKQFEQLKISMNDQLIQEFKIDQDFSEFLAKTKKQVASQKLQNEILAQRLVNEKIKADQLPQFIKEWRIHFINSMNPQYLTQGWTVEHKVVGILGNK